MQGTDSLLELEGVWPCYTLILEYLVSSTVRESTSGFWGFVGDFFVCFFGGWGAVLRVNCTEQALSRCYMQRDLKLLCSMWGLSSPIRDRTHAPCIGRQALHHWTTRDVHPFLF